MTCLCNVPSDLASDGIAEPKTTEKEKKKEGGGGETKHKKKKARVIFLTSVNRCCARWVYSQGAIGSRCKGGGGVAGEGDAASCLLGVSVCIDKVSAP